MALVESDMRRVAILVDELLAQQQVVIKSLETNFKQVPGLFRCNDSRRRYGGADPRCPYLLGVVNLRGAIVPVIDPRVRFDLACVPYDATTVILVLRVRHPGGERTAGVVVDSVDDVQSFSSDCIRPPPARHDRSILHSRHC